MLPASCNKDKGHARLCGRTVCPWRDRRSSWSAIPPLLMRHGKPRRQAIRSEINVFGNGASPSAGVGTAGSTGLSMPEAGPQP
jgi:hypothetical protein